MLRDINLEVRRGERIVICGPSGSGKSTLLRCINRLEEHQKGQIVVNRVELTDDMRRLDAVRRDVGRVFQHFNLFPHLTILENCTLAPIWVRKIPKKEAEETAMHFLTKVKIPEQAHKYPGQLSGGQQQRVAIARSLCTVSYTHLDVYKRQLECMLLMMLIYLCLRLMISAAMNVFNSAVKLKER